MKTKSHGSLYLFDLKSLIKHFLAHCVIQTLANSYLKQDEFPCFQGRFLCFLSFPLRVIYYMWDELMNNVAHHLLKHFVSTSQEYIIRIDWENRYFKFIYILLNSTLPYYQLMSFLDTVGSSSIDSLLLVWWCWLKQQPPAAQATVKTIPRLLYTFARTKTF